MSAISIKDLRKSFDGVEAVKGISFDVPEGSYFAFLGVNGAGKSTTISILCSLLKRDSGEVEVFGRDPSDPDVRRDIGVVFQEAMMDGRMTVRENVSVRGAMYGLKGGELRESVESALELSDSLDFADHRYGSLSGGQRRRADIARALVHGPRLLILDEPTSGLDPKTRMHIGETLRSLNRDRGITVFLTTHYMEEASCADDVVVLDKGRVIARGTPSELKDRWCSDCMRIRPKDPAELKARLGSMGIGFEEDGPDLVVGLASTADAVPIINEVGGMIASFEVRMGTLDDAFIRMTEASE